MKSSFRRGNNGYVGVNKADEFYSGIQSNQTRRIYQDLEEWTRPSYWLSLPDITANDQKLCMLMDIFKGASGNTGATADSNFIGFTISGNYIVDWGNGITQSFTGGNRAQYQYNFENLSSSITQDGTKQVIIQAYPQAGATLTSINLSTAFQGTGITLASGFLTGYNTGLLEIKVAGKNINSFVFHASNNNQWHQRMAQFEYVGPSALTSCSFSRCYGLRRVIGTEWTQTFTSLNSMFYDCNRLTSIPVIESSKATTAVSMFEYSGIRNVPLFDTSKVTNFANMFANCTNLQSIPPFNTSSGTNFSSMFNSSTDLRDVPHLDTSNATNMNSMFRSCPIAKVPFFNTSKVTDMGYMFLFCGLLMEVPPFDTSNVTSAYGMFRGCGRIKKVPQFNFSKVTDLSEIFYSGPRTITIPKLDTSKVTKFDSMFLGSYYQHIPEMDGSCGTSFSSIFSNCSFTTGGIIKNIGASISYANMQLLPGNLNAIFDNLRSGVSGPTITITNCWGATGCDRTKATSKGWAVTG